MTHEEIERTTERLREHYNSTYDVMLAFMGWDSTDVSRDCKSFQNALIDLLRQADPDTYMGLPVDADGVPIHVGDVIVMEDGTTVYALAVNGNDFAYNYGCGVAITQAHNKHHYHKPTVEDVLLELVDVAIGDIADKARNENMTYNDWAKSNEVIAEYASKLREVMADE